MTSINRDDVRRRGAELQSLCGRNDAQLLAAWAQDLLVELWEQAPAEPPLAMVVSSDSGGDAAAARYESCVQAVRAAVGSHVPDGDVVAVITKGDSRLLDLVGRTAWHFPRTSSGQWAGHHPATSEGAVLLLEEARVSGARWFVVPAPYSWWLSYYDGFAAHLDHTARLLPDVEGCTVFDLRRPLQELAVPDAEKAAYGYAVAALRELLVVLLPAGAQVLVVSRGDDSYLELGGLQASHFPSWPGTGYCGHPADSDEAVRMLEALRDDSDSYFVLPALAGWWSDHYPEFLAHLHRTATVVVEQPHVGCVFALSPPTKKV